MVKSRTFRIRLENRCLKPLSDPPDRSLGRRVHRPIGPFQWSMGLGLEKRRRSEEVPPESVGPSPTSLGFCGHFCSALGPRKGVLRAESCEHRPFVGG